MYFAYVATRRSLVALALVSVVGAGCGGQRTAAAPSPTAGTPRPRSRADLITRADIERTSFVNTYELVRALKGNWLNARGPDSINGTSSEVQIHVDEVRLGGVASLRDIHPNDVAAIQYFDPITASGRWGLGYAAGAIMVTTRKR